MTLTVEPLLDSDVEESLQLQHAAFHSGGGMSLLLTPAAELSPTQLRELSAQRRKKLAENPHAHFLKVVDSELGAADGSKGRMIGVAHWDVFGTGATAADLDELCAMPPRPALERDAVPSEAFAEAVGRAWDDFFGYMVAARRRFFPRGPAALLNVLCVHPSAQRRGAGAMLVEWGVEKADAMGLTGLVEGSRMGAPLYARYGFEVVHRERFDMGTYGKEFEGKHDENVIMIRPKKGEKLEYPTV